ncbi:cold shock domain-containing protein [Shewanella psychropiezotolerans]|uniref:Cold shock domain-containing protein n=1 Tax=Shewanella psychropiezotolerans TaxID=2593655 RepID=A0ABX5WWS8_9GAMM|nr:MULTISPECIES: cold shock domain-containing protein [Shewanella]MPY22958.1 cold shock domain-containing protein [Shewanella sp. YLB-07]QDO82627.1 cold shock domain-containing protein [Shewanella psychropiezotolerans]
MKTQILKGLLIRWNDDKGFGFLRPDASHVDMVTLHGPASDQEIFIHISVLKHMSRRPKVGDTIFFLIETKLDSKLNAIQAYIEGVEANTDNVKDNKPYLGNGNSKIPISSSAVIARLLIIAVLLIGGSLIYQMFTDSNTTEDVHRAQ